jgi:hypothetical protein
MNATLHRNGLALMCVFLVALSGCAVNGLWKLKKDEFRKADARNPAVQIVCLWQPAEGLGLDNLPTRGFAGQIIFLTQDSPTPVEIDGDVRVYLFDDQGTMEEQAKPLHQFDFVDGTWRGYLKKTAWGPTYQVFIPYVRKGSHEAKCVLRVRLTPKAGPTIVSETASITLQGTVPLATAVPASAAVSDEHPDNLPSQHSLAQGAANTPKRKADLLDPQFVTPRKFESFTVPQ